MLRIRFASAVVCLLLLQHTAVGQEPAPRGGVLLEGPVQPTAQIKYDKQWALIIGINRCNNPDIPELKNAENDAQLLKDLLVKHYGYQDDAIRLLIGNEATHDTILKQLGGDFLGQAKGGDSVLIFFAGHGDRLKDASGKDCGIVLYPADLTKPDLTTTILLHDDLVQKFNGSCEARHKLLILDACHSGGIFERQATAPSVGDNRQTKSLFNIKAFQAVASCRAPETASDGRDGNSPFTASLLNALQSLPNYEEQEYFTLTSLFQYMEKDLRARLPSGQSPRLDRLTSDDGEFRFFPDRQSDLAQYLGRAVDYRLLAAMIPGEFGTWWFDEMPWMIPSLRMAIISRSDTKRTTSLDVINKAELLQSAQQAKADLERKKDDLVRLRLQHLDSLINLTKAKESKDFLRGMVADLCCFPKPRVASQATPTDVEACLQEVRDNQSKLEPTDVHLLAVLLHFLNENRTAEQAYGEALRAYEYERANKSRENRAMEALCRADFGYFLLGQSDCLNAARQFRNAWTLFGTVAPPPFQVFLLCQEADAWQRLGQWGEADQRLDMARKIVQGTGARNSLRAHVFNRRGWAFMERWAFAKAEPEFRESNETLVPAVAGEDRDPNAELVYFHNLHGLAMARRFRGDSRGAAEEYRTLLNEHLPELSRKLRKSGGLAEMAPDFRKRLALRWLNTMDRLADCNLFAAPPQRDLAETVDDLRRALRYCHALPFHQRDRQQASLMYKMAIALSLKSSVQDVALAEAYCREADALVAKMENQASPLDFPRKLTPAIVALFTASETSTALDNKREALQQLRTAIHELREEWRANDNRDNLEFLMFATKVLIDEGIDADRFETIMDTEMLLSFCRRTLQNKNNEALPYLRTYYDAVMAAKLRLKPKHVKELLEVQFEATRGESFRKPTHAVPILAVYVLKEKGYVFLDVPTSVSKYYLLDEDYCSESEIRKAMFHPTSRLELPREVQKELQRVEPSPEGKRLLDCWWKDPLLERIVDGREGETLGSRVVALKPVISGSPKTLDEVRPPERTADFESHFPFELPDGIGLLRQSESAPSLLPPGSLPPPPVQSTAAQKPPPD